MRLLIPQTSGFKPVRLLGAPCPTSWSTFLHLAWPLAHLHKTTEPRTQPTPAFYKTVVILCAIWKIENSNSVTHVTRTFISSRYPGMLLLSMPFLVLDLIYIFICVGVGVGEGKNGALSHQSLFFFFKRSLCKILTQLNFLTRILNGAKLGTRVRDLGSLLKKLRLWSCSPWTVALVPVPVSCVTLGMARCLSVP